MEKVTRYTAYILLLVGVIGALACYGTYGPNWELIGEIFVGCFIGFLLLASIAEVLENQAKMKRLMKEQQLAIQGIQKKMEGAQEDK